MSNDRYKLYIRHLSWCQMRQASLLAAGDGPNKCNCGLAELTEQDALQSCVIADPFTMSLEGNPEDLLQIDRGQLVMVLQRLRRLQQGVNKVCKEISGQPAIVLLDGKTYHVIPTTLSDELELLR